MEVENVAKNNTILTIVIVIAAVFLLSGGNLGGITNFLKAPTTTTTTVSQTGGEIKTTGTLDLSCPDKTQGVTMTVGPMTRRGRASTSVSSESVWVYVNGVETDSVPIVSATTRTVSPGDSVELIYAANSSGYYAAKQTFTAPCNPFRSADPALDPNKASQIMQNGSFTSRVFNNDDGDLNAVGDNESITSGENLQFRVEHNIPADQAWSPFGNWITVLDMNSTDFDEDDTEIIQNDGTTAKKVTVPSGHPNPGAGFVSRAWEMTQSCTDVCTIKYTIALRANSDINPGPDTGANVATVNASHYDSDWYRDRDLPIHKFGIEDSSGNLTGQHSNVGVPAGSAGGRQLVAIAYI